MCCWYVCHFQGHVNTYYTLLNVFLTLCVSDRERALQAMEACQSAGDEGFRSRAERLLTIFQSDLFQALLGE